MTRLLDCFLVLNTIRYYLNILLIGSTYRQGSTSTVLLCQGRVLAISAGYHHNIRALVYQDTTLVHR